MNALTFPILHLLADGQFHSGEDLARHFGVTRATVWNALQQAEQLGVRLFSVRGRGYRLPEPVRFVDAGRVQAGLGGLRDRFALEIHDQLDSTNSYLMRQAADGAPSGTCALAHLQTAGRGRRGRSWQAGLGGSLTFSVLWRFDGGAGSLSGLSLAVGVALLRALRAVGAEGIKLKWPNDVLHDGGKLAGILIELQGDMDGPSAAVIGIGLNLRLPAELRRDIDQPAAELRDVLGELPASDELLAVLLRHLAEVLLVFEREGFAALREEWAAGHAYRGRPVRMLMPDGRAIEGLVSGVAEDGALLLDVGGAQQRFSAGEVSLRGARMILTVDAGNSRTKWGLFDDDGTLLRHEALDNRQLARLLDDWKAYPGLRRVVISCVGGQDLAGELRRACESLQLATRWISPSERACGVRNGYARPQQLGSDRWAALVAAWNEFRAPCVVATAGTALTVDALAADGTFLGGLIVPGLGLMRTALAKGTAGIGEADGHWQDFPLATADAVHSGSLAALGGAVRHMMGRLQKREGRPPLCLLAGGDAPLLAPLLDFPVQMTPHLVLRGLFLLEKSST